MSRCQVAAPVLVSCVSIWVSSPLVSTESSLHLHGTFFMFGAVLLLLLPVSYLILPETKDISLGDLLVIMLYLLTINIAHCRAHRATLSEEVFDRRCHLDIQWSPPSYLQST